MSYETLAIVNAPTLAGGLVELLRLADALAAADHLELDCGVIAWREPDGHLAAAEPWCELPRGVIETRTAEPVDPWTDTDASYRSAAAAARLELLQLLAYVNPDRDLLATAEFTGYLGVDGQ